MPFSLLFLAKIQTRTFAVGILFFSVFTSFNRIFPRQDFPNKKTNCRLKL